MSIPGAILPPQTVTATVALEPVYNILTSMAALVDTPRNTGLDDWVIQTVASLPRDVLHRNIVLFWAIGLDPLTNAVPRGAATATFPAYLDALAARNSLDFRDQCLYWLIHSAQGRIVHDVEPLPAPDPADILADPIAYEAYFKPRISKKPFQAIWSEAHGLLTDPPRFHKTLVDHLHVMWEGYLAPEWQRIQPMLQESVDAFQHVDLTELSIFEAMRVVTGRDLHSIFRPEELQTFQRIRFIPTIHNGPYISFFGNDDELRMTFAARVPHTARGYISPLDNLELVNRLKALADDTRMQIVHALQQEGELSTQEIMVRFQLSKSATSRHLRPLHATSLISERRVDGAKKLYTLNTETINETTQAMAHLTA